MVNRYTDDELIKLLQAKAKSLGRTPTTRDANSDNDMPNSLTYIGRFSSWNKALEAAGLSPNSYHCTDEELIKFLKMKAESLGRIPTTRDVNSDSSIPSLRTYMYRFGSWDKALKAADFSHELSRERKSKYYHCEYTNEDLIKLLKEKAESLGRTPVIRDVKFDNDMPNHSLYWVRFGSWNQALEAAGLSPNNYHCTNGELIKFLKMKAESLGRTPTVEDINSDSSIPSVGTYIRMFNSWNKALKAAGLTVNGSKFRGCTNKELISLLKTKAESLGRTPIAKDIESDSNMPSSITYAHRFGSWNQALEAAGLTPNRTGYKKK